MADVGVVNSETERKKWGGIMKKDEKLYSREMAGEMSERQRCKIRQGREIVGS